MKRVHSLKNAELGLLKNLKDNIPGPANLIGAPKNYILGKSILGTNILMLGFFWGLITKKLDSIPIAKFYE